MTSLEEMAARQMWRYNFIERGRDISRLNGMLRFGDYIVCDVVTHWQPGRLIEIFGSKVKSLMICMDLGESPCNLSACDSGCVNRLWTLADHTGVVGQREIELALQDPPIELADSSGLPIVDPQAAAVFLGLIEEFKARQEQWKR